MDERHRPPDNIPEHKLQPWIMGQRYEKDSRVIFRGHVWAANWLTELRPGLGKSWRREP